MADDRSRGEERRATGAEDPDDLDALLRGEHVADAGFTETLMARLPPPRRRAPRSLLVLGAGAVGTTIALASPATPQLWRLWAAVGSAEHGLTAMVSLVCLLVVLVGSGVQAAFGE